MEKRGHQVEEILRVGRESKGQVSGNPTSLWP